MPRTRAAEPCTTRNRGSRTRSRKYSTNSVFSSIATRTASGRIRFRISRVNVPTPGPYSTSTRARSQSTCFIMSLTRKDELGTTDPSMTGLRKKLRTNSANEDDRNDDDRNDGDRNEEDRTVDRLAAWLGIRWFPLKDTRSSYPSPTASPWSRLSPIRSSIESGTLVTAKRPAESAKSTCKLPPPPRRFDSPTVTCGAGARSLKIDLQGIDAVQCLREQS